MDTVIQFENVHFSYPGDERESLHGVDLSIERGSFVAVLGQNGSGKSTLAKHMNAILVPDEGRVLVDGIDTADESRILDVRRRVGMVFQNPDNQIVANVVEDDVAFAPENLGVEPKEIRQRVDASLRLVGMYEHRQHAPHLLSGGQKQRIAIAGVIAMQPEIIVLDEPTAMLDPQGRREVVDTVFSLCRSRGMTVILITHHMEECIDADRVLILSKGRLTADGRPEEIFADRALLEAEGLEQPETARLLRELRAAGMKLPGEALDTAGCADKIAQALQAEERSRSSWQKSSRKN
ncbi:MAG: energy-coupling factor transporter ATPase [Oscillospiraceae bacterium]|nr:energy-coupling factor transporter ATPase [Oscillospiraceae bacterium]